MDLYFIKAVTNKSSGILIKYFRAVPYSKETYRYSRLMHEDKKGSYFNNSQKPKRFETVLKTVLSQAAGKKIAILGCGSMGAVLCCAVLACGRQVECFIGENAADIFCGRKVCCPSWLKHVNIDDYFILNSSSIVGGNNPVLESYGLIEGCNYSNLEHYFKSDPCDCNDPLLGYSRRKDGDLDGFETFGEKTGESLMIVALGGSTTDPSYSNIKSWPEILHSLLLEAGMPNIVYNGGLVGYTSTQEREKFLRDVIAIRPQYVFSFSGINDVGWIRGDCHHPYYSQHVLDRIRKKYSHIDYTIGQPEEIADYSIWYRNQKIMQSVSQQFGISFHSLLQPCIFSRGYQKSEFESKWLSILTSEYLEENCTIKSIYTSWNCFCDRVMLLGANDAFIDFRNVFAAESGIYIDGIHCEESGNYLIAKQLAGIIADMEGEKHHRA